MNQGITVFQTDRIQVEDGKQENVKWSVWVHGDPVEIKKTEKEKYTESEQRKTQH